MARSFFDTPAVPTLWGVIIPFLVLDFVIVGLRFYVRRRLRQSFLADDWLMIPSLIGVTGLAVMYFYGLGTKALGYRWSLIPEGGVEDMLNPDYVPVYAESTNDRIMLTRRLEYSSLVVFAFINGLIKISVLLFYRRIFVVAPTWRNTRNLFFTGMITLIALWAGVSMFVFVFMCGTSFQTLFQSIPQDLAVKCVDTLKVGWQYAIADFASDGLIVLIPIPFIWSLNLPTSRKVAVTSCFLLGILASGASLTRLAWMYYNQNVGFSPETDEELMITYELFWMQLEIVLGLMAANLPTMRGLFKSESVDSKMKKIRSLFSLRSSSSGSFRSYSKSSTEKSRAITVTVNSDFSRLSDAGSRV